MQGRSKDKDAFVCSDDEVELLLSRVNDYKRSSGVDAGHCAHQTHRDSTDVSKCIEERASPRSIPFSSVESFNLMARAALLFNSWSPADVLYIELGWIWIGWIDLFNGFPDRD